MRSLTSNERKIVVTCSEVGSSISKRSGFYRVWEVGYVPKTPVVLYWTQKFWSTQLFPQIYFISVYPYFCKKLQKCHIKMKTVLRRIWLPCSGGHPNCRPQLPRFLGGSEEEPDKINYIKDSLCVHPKDTEFCWIFYSLRSIIYPINIIVSFFLVHSSKQQAQVYL